MKNKKQYEVQPDPQLSTVFICSECGKVDNGNPTELYPWSHVDSDTNHHIKQRQDKSSKVRGNVDTETTEPEDSSSGTKLATIYVDGSASKGGKSPIGSGLIVYLEGEPHSAHYGLYEPVGTNNIAELNALKAALEKATKLINSGFHVEIRADSEYALKSTSVWAYNWKKKGWKKANSKTPENLALIKECHFLYEDLMDSLSLKHVKAHSGIEGNEVADTLASLAVDKKQRSLIEIPVSEAIPTLR